MFATSSFTTWSALSTVCLLASFDATIVSAQARVVAAQPKQVDYLAINSVYRPDPGARGPEKFGITRNDLHFLQQTMPAARKAVPLRTMSVSAFYKDRVAKVALIGCTPELAELAGIRITQGRFLTASDETRADNVCVIGEALRRRLFPVENPVGRNVRVDRQYFLIVGVADSPRIDLPSVGEVYGRSGNSRKRRTGDATKPPNREIYVPLRAMRARFGDIQISRGEGTFEGRQFELSEVWIPDFSPLAAQKVQAALRSRHEGKLDFRLLRRRAYPY